MAEEAMKRGRKKYTNEHFQEIFNKKLFHQKTVAELVDLLGVKKTSIYDWSNGVSFPDIESLIKISRKCNVSVDYLLGLTEYNSLDGNYQSASRVTGLSEDTMKALKEENVGYGAMLINQFVESGRFDRFMNDFKQALNISLNCKDNVPLIGNEVKTTKADIIRFYAQEIGNVFADQVREYLDSVTAIDPRIRTFLATENRLKMNGLTTPELIKQKMLEMGASEFYKWLNDGIEV